MERAMTQVRGTKMSMTQVFKENTLFGVTPVKLARAQDITLFTEGDRVSVRGVTKGKGFQGVVKRHGFSGGPKTHGQKNRHRAPGSIGSTAPQRVIPGRRMAGRMGGVQITTKGVSVTLVRADEGIVLLNGSVPGVTRGSVILLTHKELPASETLNPKP